MSDLTSNHHEAAGPDGKTQMSELVDSTGLRFATDEAVLAHGVDFRPAWWAADVPDSWGSWLSSMPPAARGRSYRHITRRDLLAGGRPTSPDDNGRLLLGCYVWGTGDRHPRWRRKVFTETPSAELVRRLTAARDLLEQAAPAAAYEALTRGGACQVKNMRASFFTKYLYAADAADDGTCGRALILDQFVALALNDLHDWGLPEKSGWTTQDYQRWLDHAHALAVGGRVRPDAVEMAYFQHGRDLNNTRRAAARLRRQGQDTPTGETVLPRGRSGPGRG